MEFVKYTDTEIIDFLEKTALKEPRYDANGKYYVTDSYYFGQNRFKSQTLREAIAADMDNYEKDGIE